MIRRHQYQLSAEASDRCRKFLAPVPAQILRNRYDVLILPQNFAVPYCKKKFFLNNSYRHQFSGIQIPFFNYVITRSRK